MTGGACGTVVTADPRLRDSVESWVEFVPGAAGAGSDSGETVLVLDSGTTALVVDGSEETAGTSWALLLVLEQPTTSGAIATIDTNTTPSVRS